MLQALSGYFPITLEKTDEAIPVRGYPRQRLDMTRRVIRDYGYLLDQETLSRVQAEIADASGGRNPR